MTVTDWQTWAPFADALRRSAPPGTRTSEFVGTVGGGAWQGTYLDDGDAAARREHHRALALEAARSGGPGPRAELEDALRTVAAGLPDTEQLVRVTATADGAGDAVELITLPSAVVSGPVSPVLEVVLEPGALPAQHRATLAPRADAEPAPSSDPEAVARVVRERMPDAVGATPDEIEAARALLPGGARLPDEVRALYSVAASGALKLGDDDRFAGFEIVPLSGSSLRESFLPAARFGTWSADADVVAPEDPDARVQQAVGSPLWFPVGTDGAGNVYAVDLAPGPAGHLGQVVFLDHEERAGARYRADSLAALLVERVPAGAPARAAEASSAADIAGPTGDAVEFLALDPADWTARLEAGTVPESLKAAGLVPDRERPPALTEAIRAANGLLALRGLPTIEVTRLTRPAGEGRRGARRRGMLARLLGR
ncbi:SMI1/KNR4 family protein [Promicromonospora thailandica]|nr:SMI1/KNR4 family protein [Promicromonospora thailandica]